ncbi:hypothetical protein ACOMHN_011601 [Nucella lapillus]
MHLGGPKSLHRAYSLTALDAPFRPSFSSWFEVVPDDGRPVEYFDTVGGICSIKPRRFLVRTPTVGYQLSIEDGVSCWMPHEIRPGEVLTTGMVYMDNNNNGGTGGGKKGKGGSTTNSINNNNNKGFFKRLLKSSKNKNKPEQDLKYLQCFDAEGKEIMIPLIMSGVFSPVGDASMANYDAVYELQDLIMAFGLPVNAQLIHANPREKATCPSGVLRLYGTREEELAVLSRLNKDALIADPAVERVEVSVERELSLQRGLPRRRQSVHSARPAPISTPTEGGRDSAVVQNESSSEQLNVHAEVELPKRVPKELKKSKSTGILDKLSVRKVRKERARLKELKGDDVFSKRINRSELSYEDFFNGLDVEEEGSEVKNSRETDTAEGNSKNPSTPEASSVYGKTGDTTNRSTIYGTYGSAKYNIQDRDLPPIPMDSPPSSFRQDSSHGSKDSLYEHLPPAPQPPLRSHSDPAHPTQSEDDDPDDEEDGYMVPKSVRGGDSAYSSSVDVQLRRKPPTVPRGDVKVGRQRKCRSDMLPPEVMAAALASEDGVSIDVDQIFNFAETSERPYGCMAAGGQWAGSTSQLYGFRAKDKRGTDAVPAWRAEVQRQQARRASHTEGGGTLTRKSVERLDLETRSTHSRRGSTSRGQNVDANATIRSHNLRKNKRGLLELFHFSESFGDLREHTPNQTMSPPYSPVLSSPGAKYGHHQHTVTSPLSARREERGGGESPYGAVISPALMPGVGGYFRPQPYVAYADSEPSFRKSYSKPVSVIGLSDSAYPKQGDDSAISMGSRGENPYGFNNDSEYSYNEYIDNGSGSMAMGREDNWSPPDDISGLSVHEVSRSLRYIGMKDRVVLRFANEQIDGSMLCSLDKRLLKEGFPELNALEIKKILDFVRGWRPKKR